MVLIISIIFCLCIQLFGQNQHKADSLELLLKTVLDDSTKMETIYRISVNSSSPVNKIKFAEDLLNLARQTGNIYYEQAGLNSLGTAYRLLGNLEKALGYLLESAKLAETYDHEANLAIAYSEIGSVYEDNSDFDNSLTYYKLAAELFLEQRDSLSYAVITLNNGYLNYRIGRFDSASVNYKKAESVFQQKEDALLLAYVKGNRAILKLNQGLREEAESDFNEVIEQLEPLGDQYGIADFLNELGKVYVEIGDKQKAIETISKGLEIAKEIDLKAQIRDASELLTDLYRENGDFKNALRYYGQYVAYKDSIQNTETVRKLANQRAEFEIGQAEAAMNAERQTQQVINVALFSGLALLTIFGIAQFRNSRQRMATNRILSDQKNELETQKTKLEELNHTKDRFFSIISHDLRGPVNAFHGISGLIKFFVQQKQMDQLEALTEDIDQSVDRLSSLLDNLLNWAVQQQGDFPYVPEKLDIHVMADDLVKTFATMATSKHIRLISEVEAGSEAWADRNTTMTIIRNLVSNALKFTPKNGEVKIKAEKEDASVSIRVMDNGVGIPAEKLNDLFKLQARKSTWGTDGEKGLGLGLQLVHEFVELNQGQIKVDSQDGKGTTFMVILPAYDLNQVTAEA